MLVFSTIMPSLWDFRIEYLWSSFSTIMPSLWDFGIEYLWSSFSTIMSSLWDFGIEFFCDNVNHTGLIRLEIIIETKKKLPDDSCDHQAIIRKSTPSVKTRFNPYCHNVSAIPI